MVGADPLLEYRRHCKWVQVGDCSNGVKCHHASSSTARMCFHGTGIADAGTVARLRARFPRWLTDGAQLELDLARRNRRVLILSSRTETRHARNGDQSTSLPSRDGLLARVASARVVNGAAPIHMREPSGVVAA